MNKVKKEFISPALLKVCFYLWIILLLLTPAAYIYDYESFDFSILRSFLFALAGCYTFALITYIEILQTQRPSSKPFFRFLIPVSNIVSFILLALFALSALDYINGNLKLDRIYDPVIQLFFVYLISRGMATLRQNLDDNEMANIS